MSSPPDFPGHHRRYSWTSSLPGEGEEQHGPVLVGEARFPEHEAQDAQGPQGEHARSTSSFQDSLRSFFSHISPTSIRPKEFVVTRRRAGQSRANMDDDKDETSAPNCRTLTPGPLLTLGNNGRSPRTTLPPNISVQIPDSTLQQEPESQSDTPNTPDPTTTSAQASKSVTFAPPVRSHYPQSYYTNFTNDETSMINPYTTESSRRSVSNQQNIDSDFRLKTRRRSTEYPVEKLKKHASFFNQRRLSSLLTTNTGPNNDESALLLPQRSASTSSSTKSISDHLSFLRFPSKPKKSPPKPGPSPPTPASPTNTFTDLPTDRALLEGRINYHISRLDRLRRRLADLNRAIRQETAEYSVAVASLRRQGMDTAAEDLGKQLQWLGTCRDGLKPSVTFHRGELERIARKRIEMDATEGYEAALPAVYDGLDGDEIWEGRFAVWAARQ